MKKLSIKKVLLSVAFLVIVAVLCFLGVAVAVYFSMAIGTATFSVFLTEDSLALAYVCMISAASGCAMIVFYVIKLLTLSIKAIKSKMLAKKD